MADDLDGDDLDATFIAHRPRLRATAARVLGGDADADDVLQEAWLRASRAGTGGVDNVPGWLTTIVVRTALNTVRTRTARREDVVDSVGDAPDPDVGPEDEAMLAESVDLALDAVLSTLGPAERTAFVLHDLFAMSFEEIALLTGRSAVSARQAASRGRRRLDGAETSRAGRNEPVVTAFRAASRDGDLSGLLALLDPDVVMRSDAAAAITGAPPLMVGATAVAGFVNGKAAGALSRRIDAAAGLVYMLRGEIKVAFEFTVIDDRIAAIDLLGESDTLAATEIV